ncbi:hypothetical protein F4810DRAFT_225860 [Camillea tinctor]|nr:hypothetical protein F4810DRAFT_225860 [Camillea tinctor]
MLVHNDSHGINILLLDMLTTISVSPCADQHWKTSPSTSDLEFLPPSGFSIPNYSLLGNYMLFLVLKLSSYCFLQFLFQAVLYYVAFQQVLIISAALVSCLGLTHLRILKRL